MADVIFEDYTIRVQKAIDSRILGALEDCAGELESAAKSNTRVDTGRTKSEWKHHIDKVGHTAYIGNTTENSIWEEFGTGEYALAGNGRKGGWHYKDAKGEWHFTHGKTPSRAFWHAYTALKGAIIKHMQDSLRGL